MAAVQLRLYCLLPELASHGHRTPALVHPDQQANPRHNQTGAVQLARPGPHTSLAHVLRHRGSRRQAAARNLHVVNLLPLNFGFVGIVCLTLLFHESTKLTEKITSAKYADYKEYQGKVSRILLGLPGRMNAKKLD